MTRVRYITKDEMRVLWRMLERLQADVQPGGPHVWRDTERDALITVMDAIKDTAG